MVWLENHKKEVKNIPRGEWRSVPVPENLVEEVDKRVESDKYPQGKYHSRSHYVVEAIKEKLQRETEKHTT